MKYLHCNNCSMYMYNTYVALKVWADFNQNWILYKF